MSAVTKSASKEVTKNTNSIMKYQLMLATVNSIGLINHSVQNDLEPIAKKELRNPIGKRIRAEEVLKLYHREFSLATIARHLDRSEKWVRRCLAQFGIRIDKGRITFIESDIPFGWQILNNKIAPYPFEQKILHNIDHSLKTDKNLTEICKYLNLNKIKPRVGRKWITSMIPRAVAVDKKLKTFISC